MPELTEYDTTLTRVGRHGLSERVPLTPDVPGADSTTAMYLVTAPSYHPVWKQYAIVVVDLTTDRPDVGPPTLHFDGATHELLVLAINPADGPVSPIGLCERAKRPAPQLYLHPPNVGHQFTATDQEMTTVAWLCGRAVVGGDLNPETGDAPDLLREQWLQACVLTLAHLRGEEHAGHAS